MTTEFVTLRPDAAPVGWGSGSGGAFGAAPQWADDDDSTGATRTIGSTMGGVAALLPTLTIDPATVVGITAWARLSSTAGSATFTLGYDETSSGSQYLIDISQDPTKFFFPITSGGTLALYALTQLHDGSGGGRGVPFVAAALAAGGVWVSFRPLATGATITVTEAAVVVEYEAAPPVARLWPRDDALGLGTANRLVPTPRANRIIGRQP